MACKGKASKAQLTKKSVCHAHNRYITFMGIKNTLQVEPCTCIYKLAAKYASSHAHTDLCFSQQGGAPGAQTCRRLECEAGGPEAKFGCE